MWRYTLHLAAALGLMLGSGCAAPAGPDREERGDAERGRAALALVEMPSKALARCRATALLADVCPTRVPALSSHFFVDSSRSSHPSIFSLESGTPETEGIAAANRPPQYVRVTIEAGDLDRALDFAYPMRGRPQALATLERRGRRERAAFIAREVWAGSAGSVVLAPSYPDGGFHHDHVAFRWTDNGVDYIVSLHAWAPLAEAKATLRAIVASIP